MGGKERRRVRRERAEGWQEGPRLVVPDETIAERGAAQGVCCQGVRQGKDGMLTRLGWERGGRGAHAAWVCLDMAVTR